MSDVQSALNRVTKWRSIFTGWQLGTRAKGDPEGDAVRDHRELSIIHTTCRTPVCLWYAAGMARTLTALRLADSAIDWMDTLALELSTPRVRVTRSDVMRTALALAKTDEAALRRALSKHVHAKEVAE